MKKAELSFKCVLPNKNAGMCIRLALKNIGLIKTTEDDYAHYQLFAYNRGIVATMNLGVFCFWSEPLMSYEDALKLIESIEPDAPEFDIKMRDEVLVRHSGRHQFWQLADFAAYRYKQFSVKGGNVYATLIKYEGNEHFHGTTDMPDGWWECENGTPVWRTKWISN